MNARIFGSALIFAASCRLIRSTTSFSRTPVGPAAPGSLPPWPASIAMTISRPVGLVFVLPVAGRGNDGIFLTTRGASSGNKSTTRRCPCLPFGASKKLRGFAGEVISRTIRTVPSLRLALRMRCTAPVPDGNGNADRSICPGMISMTTRCGLDSMKILCSVRRDRSTAMRVLPACEAIRTSLICTGSACTGIAMSAAVTNMPDSMVRIQGIQACNRLKHRRPVNRRKMDI